MLRFWIGLCARNCRDAFLRQRDRRRFSRHPRPPRKTALSDWKTPTVLQASLMRCHGVSGRFLSGTDPIPASQSMCRGYTLADHACVTASERWFCLESGSALEPIYSPARRFDFVDDRQFKGQRVVSMTTPFSCLHYALLEIDQKV